MHQRASGAEGVRAYNSGKAIGNIFLLRSGVNNIAETPYNNGSVLYLRLDAGVRVYVKNLFSLFLAPQQASLDKVSTHSICFLAG